MSSVVYHFSYMVIQKREIRNIHEIFVSARHQRGEMEDIMKTVCRENKCNGCKACIDKCPKSCIIFRDDINNMNCYIDESKCINCHLCENLCPNNNEIEAVQPIFWRQGWTQLDSRAISSSGGAAFTIINMFIQSGGYVAACLFKDGDFIFEITNDLGIAKKFAGSKYVKSNPIGIYAKISHTLQKHKVLFIGLPCQVAALKNYIKNKENLYTIDLICHGTPSAKLLKKFLEEKNFYINELKDIKFRKKQNMVSPFDDKSIALSCVTDEYSLTFLKSINYTENCYSCQFANIKRVSDITLGDSWGTEYKCEERNGVSLILCQTEKGIQMLNDSKMILKEVDLNQAIEYNHQLSRPSVKPEKRTMFLKLIEDGKTYRYATYKCLPKTIFKQNIKYLMLKLHIIKSGRYGITIVK